jgi:thiamine biosynthesis lipoprotein
LKKGFIFIFIVLLVSSVLSYDYFFSVKERTIYAMDTVMTIKIKGKEINLDKAEEIIRNIDAEFNSHKESSFIYRLNNGEKLYAPDEVCNVIKSALDYCYMTDGAFDITLKEVKDLWENCSEKGIVPNEKSFEKLLFNSDYSKIEVKDNYISLNGNKIDLGGFIKGYTADCIVTMFKDNGVKEAVIDLGGNVYAYSDKENVKIGIQDPKDLRGNVVCITNADDGSVVSSGTYERYYEINNKKYHHIFNPQTGYPAENGILSVTIKGENSAMCDAFSTALLVMGEENAINFYKENNNFEFMIIKDKDIVCSKNFNGYDFADGYNVIILN